MALDFEITETKKLLSKFDFKFFLTRNIEANSYKQSDIDSIYSSYNVTRAQIKLKAKTNKRQFNYYSEGQVRKMFTGGLLPFIFELDKNRGGNITDFNAIGENWAYFDYWKKYQRRKITKEKIWDLIIKGGSILGIILGILKLLEYTMKHNSN